MLSCIKEVEKGALFTQACSIQFAMHKSKRGQQGTTLKGVVPRSHLMTNFSYSLLLPFMADCIFDRVTFNKVQEEAGLLLAHFRAKWSKPVEMCTGCLGQVD